MDKKQSLRLSSLSGLSENHKPNNTYNTFNIYNPGNHNYQLSRLFMCKHVYRLCGCEFVIHADELATNQKLQRMESAAPKPDMTSYLHASSSAQVCHN